MASYVIDMKDELSAVADKAAGALDRMGKALRSVGFMSATLDQATSKALGGFLGKVDPASKLTSVFADKAASLGAALNPATLAISAIGAAADLAVGAVTGTVEGLWNLGKAAVEVTQKRGQMLATFDAITDGAGKEALGALKALSKELPFTTGEMAVWAKGLAAAGMRDVPTLTKGVRAVAAATAIMGEDASGPVTMLLEKMSALGELGATIKFDNKLVKQLLPIGLSISDISKQLGKTPEELRTMGVSAKEMGAAIQDALIKKGKGPLDRLGLGWDAISKKIAGVGDLFGDMGPSVDPFMGQVKSLFGEFFKGSTLVNGAKSVVTSVFTEIFQVATRVVRAIHIGFLTAAISVLNFAASAAPTVKALRQIWQEHDGAGKLLFILKGLAVMAGVIVAGFVTVLAVLGVMGAIGTAAVGALAAGFVWLVDAIPDAAGALADFVSSAWDVAADFVKGLADGILSKATWVLDAIRGLGTSAVDALKSVLQISSPSKVMIQAGGYTAQGFAQGIDGGAALAARAGEGLGESVATASAAPGSRAGGGRSIPPMLITITNNGVDSEGRMLELTEANAVRIFERLATVAT